MENQRSIASLFCVILHERSGGEIRLKSVNYVKGVIVLFLAVWAMLLGTGIGHIYNLAHSIQRISPAQLPEAGNSNLSEEAQETMKGYWTLALFGLDSRDGSLGKGNQSDVVMICNINLDSGEIKLASVYRDTYLKIDRKGNYNKINQAYCNGGAAESVAALKENLDLKIDDYAAFNWKAVVDAVNLLGGIDLEVSQAEFRVINGFITETVESTGVPSRHLKKAGMNHLDGVQAVAYARLRKMDTDFKRTERQRKVVKLVMEKARHADFAVINHILVSVLPQISTSIGMDDVLPLARRMGRFHLGETSGFPFALEDVMLDGKDCVIPDTLEENVKMLHEYFFDEEGYDPSDQVKKISASIAARASRGDRRGN